MDDIQKAALKVLLAFQRFCKDNSLRYFAIGGTCIGAVRHKGFIPWDDDIDVAMPSDDYFRFIELAKNGIDSKYEVMGPFTCRHYNAPYIKLHDIETTFIESFMDNYPDRFGGVYIDIFPIFGLPSNDRIRRIISLKCDIYNSLNNYLRFPYQAQPRRKMKLMWIAVTPLRILLPYDYYVDKELKMLSKYSFDNSDKVIFCWRFRKPPKGSPNYTYKNIFYYEDFAESITVPFETAFIKVPIGYDRYLKMDFGDYMKLPPEEKRIPGHPKTVVDLNKSYKEYVQKRRQI